MSNDWVRPVVHFEITSRNPETLVPFYEAMFNWPVGEGFIRNFPAGIGGPEPGPAGHFRQSHQSGVTLFIQVRSVTDSLKQAEALGGAITMQPLQIPNGAMIAGISDPEGNPITLVQQ